jgi:hypothetical protein
MKGKRVAVGLWVMTEVPNVGLAAVLQRRGKVNPETGGPESYPGGYQPTVFGGVEKNESIPMALNRETREGLGDRFWLALLGGTALYLIKEVYRSESDERLDFHHAVKVPPEFLKYIPSSDRFKCLRRDEIDSIQDLTKFDRREGVANAKIIAMFPDCIEALKKTFELFSRT